MKYKIIAVATILALSGCSTMNESLQLGAGVGFVSGAAAMHAAESRTGQRPDTDSVLTGAAVGAGIGLLVSYFTHRTVENDRKSNFAEQTEMYFGDLPPSPFLVPKPNKKGGK
jgi:hypothetical protein